MIGYIIAVLLAGTYASASGSRRPFYIVGHMVNSIPEVSRFLDKGANALESDITFFNNGSIRQIYHGSPCDCFRKCTKSANLTEYLDHVRAITDPKSGKYRGRMIFQLFDLKLNNVNPDRKFQAGVEMADQVLDHLWGDSGAVKALLYINSVQDNATIVGFQRRFRDRGAENLLENVGYDGGLGSLKQTRDMFKSIGVSARIWQGDGNINCFNRVYPDSRLRRLLETRDAPNGYMSKVYHWTIDDVHRMHKSLKLKVDGMITNVPDRLFNVLRDEQFTKDFRIATIYDDPFMKYIPEMEE